WLLAACAAVAHARPAMLLRRVTGNGDGSFNVQLGADDFRVTPEFPAEGYAEPCPEGRADTLWVALVEKAFAIREAGAFAHLELGNPARALEALTGRPSVRVVVPDASGPGPDATGGSRLERITGMLREARRAGAAIVLTARAEVVSGPLEPGH